MNPFNWSDEYLSRMTALIGPAVVYDIEVLPNVFTLDAESIDKNDNFTWEISDRRNDIDALLQWFDFLITSQLPMIGYNNERYDYPVIHEIFMKRRDVTYQGLYEKSKAIINFQGKGFSPHAVWPDRRFVPQIDLFKVHHFDNFAKSQSLKGLEFNMRSESVLEGNVNFDAPLAHAEIDKTLIPYNIWDVRETKNFALISAEAISFRRDMSSQIKGDVVNFNDTKIGKELLAQRLGDDVCYTWNPRKAPRQTRRETIPLSDVIFPYISFQHPEFNRVLEWMRGQTLKPADWDEKTGTSESGKASTKGVFSDVHAVIDGFRFDFGTGGIHGSVNGQAIAADADYMIEDIDVASLYPSIAIVNRLYPEHLGEKFIAEYSNLKTERFKYDKKSAQNGALKLALNGTYGDSNNEFSPFYDPLFTMKITINGQLMLCMLAERIMRVPTVQIIQINTDGMTYKVHRSMKDVTAAIHSEWERFTLLDLEKAYYSRMWVRDVNNYVAESAKDGKCKLKGAYWYADGNGYPGGWTEAISKAGPSAWHKDLSAHVVQRAAVAAMLHGIDPALFLRLWRDPFDFMLRAKAPRGAKLLIGDREVQKITRYYIASAGEPLHKVAMPTGEIGQFKRKSKLSDFEFDQIMNVIGPGIWDERIHTANKSRYEMVDTSFHAGYQVAECNRSEEFRFDNLNYGWYETEANKLIIK